ncbi:MAG: hypothetical protein L0Y72_28280 [Gemmataceae bacterium]|nr:hypothetical protein [Gemmataceae bacterium]MCI0742945.1 hypothetical protein [Gemmataceae bacterium]
MRRSAVIGCGLLVLALFVGCGGQSEEDKIYGEMEKFCNDMIKTLEKAQADAKTNPQAAMAAMGEVMAAASKMQDLDKRVKALPKDRQDALEKRVKESSWMKRLESLKK